MRLTKPQQKLLDDLRHQPGNGFYAAIGREIQTAMALERKGLIECGIKINYKGRGEFKPWTELAVRAI